MFCFFFKQKTAYEMRISDWSSDVCSSDLSISRSAVEQPFQNQPFIEWGCFEEAVESKSSPESSPGKMAAQRLLEALDALPMLQARSEERRVGKERVSTCRSRWSPYH